MARAADEPSGSGLRQPPEAPPPTRERGRGGARRPTASTSAASSAALFVLYGVILIVLGIVGDHRSRHKAAGINIDLWTGLGMLVFGGLMIFWALARPVAPEPSEIPKADPAEPGAAASTPASRRR